MVFNKKWTPAVPEKEKVSGGDESTLWLLLCIDNLAPVSIIILVITWAPKACKMMAFWAIIMGLGPLFCIFWWLR